MELISDTLHSTNAINQIPKTQCYLYERKKPFCICLVQPFFTQRELPLNELNHKQLPSQIHSATLISDNQIKFVQCSVKHETVIPSQKHDLHPILADFRIDQFSVRIFRKGENF